MLRWTRQIAAVGSLLMLTGGQIACAPRDCVLMLKDGATDPNPQARYLSDSPIWEEGSSGGVCRLPGRYQACQPARTPGIDVVARPVPGSDNEFECILEVKEEHMGADRGCATLAPRPEGIVIPLFTAPDAHWARKCDKTAVPPPAPTPSPQPATLPP